MGYPKNLYKGYKAIMLVKNSTQEKEAIADGWSDKPKQAEMPKEDEVPKQMKSKRTYKKKKS